MRKCPICEKGELLKVEDIIFDLDGYVFVVKGERCTNCKEEIPYEEETSRVIAASPKCRVKH